MAISEKLRDIIEKMTGKRSRAEFSLPVQTDNMTADCAAKYRVELLTNPDHVEVDKVIYNTPY